MNTNQLKLKPEIESPLEPCRQVRVALYWGFFFR